MRPSEGAGWSGSSTTASRSPYTSTARSRWSRIVSGTFTVRLPLLRRTVRSAPETTRGYPGLSYPLGRFGVMTALLAILERQADALGEPAADPLADPITDSVGAPFDEAELLAELDEQGAACSALALVAIE